VTIEFNDAWILTSISNMEGTEGATLVNIIAYADYSNHAVVTFEELEQAISRLSVIGLLKSENSKFKTNTEFKDWWKSKYKENNRISVHKQIYEVENYLNRFLNTNEGLFEQESIKLDQRKYDQAIEEYLSQLN
jgi:hypothetical protein